MKGRQSALMASAESSLIKCLTKDRSNLEDFLSQLSVRNYSAEHLVILVNTRLKDRRVPAPGLPDPRALDNHVCVLSPLHLAIKQQCQPALVDTLLKFSRKNIQRRDAACLQEYIVKCPSKTTSLAFLSDMSCLDTTDNNRRTFLHLAAMNGKDAIVRDVIASRQVGVDKVDAIGKTALIYAAEQNAPTILRLLLDAGATVDLTDAWGRTALHFAVRRAGRKAVELLLSAGADVGAEDRKGLTPLKYAISTDSLLHSHSAKENAEDLIESLVWSSSKPISLNRRDFVSSRSS
ncbi:hypothetical protein NP493_6213g00000 [Ridgeia piscesae]|uniref:Uncharacterized protein n=1 Tax=Ridgeia piscesae TaxID=27915 RepID=A0AAD9IRQ4_RIDPI|nr:hypothetical protein NP493_6213g00000 [Ridgeia piscesae]